MKIIGIAGGAGAGKTTLAKALQAHFSDGRQTAKILSLDNYYFNDGIGGRYIIGKTNGQRFLDANHPESIDPSAVAQAIAAIEADVLIIEGLFPLLVSEVRKRLDWSVYVDVPADIRLGRKIIRKLNEMQMPPEIVFRNYLETVRSRHFEFIEPCKTQADCVIDGTQQTVEQLEIVLSKFNKDG